MSFHLETNLQEAKMVVLEGGAREFYYSDSSMVNNPLVWRIFYEVELMNVEFADG